MEEGAAHVTNLLDLEPEDFEKKLGLKKLEHVRFLQAIEDRSQMKCMAFSTSLVPVTH